MRVALNNTPTVKSLKLVYSPTSLTITGTIAKTNDAIEHTHHVPPVTEIPEAKEGETPFIAKPSDGTPAYLKDDVQNTTVDAADIAFSKVITFADLKAMPGFTDYSQLAFGVHFQNGTVQYHEVFSRTTTTQKRGEALEPQHFYVVAVTVPAANVTSFDDCLVQVNCAKEAFTFNGAYSEPTAIEHFRALMPALTIVGPDAITAAGGQFIVSYAWPDGTVIAGAEVRSEVTAGYINRQRIHTNSAGKAYFMVLPLALDKGEKFRLKFGFKHFTGKAEKTVSVS